ncbi:zinc ribbon domain-containing protein [Burkholderia cenocepacia]|uniref:zinc ribbon domain-containing protein n=1 Tax=Burkholderia cenocepacia TaxID=95486 RepID=UPI001B93B85A|nr:zinc ribbon domain-containing protein [Burkholderia cenocepacia]MBR8435238.1 zinc ribbon domain-containing protein [Burkholderia cenocepacia]
MAMTVCRECGATISDQAAACVQCGAPLPKIKKKASDQTRGMIGLIFIVAAGIYIWNNFSTDRPNHDSGSVHNEKPACAKDDLQCLGEKGSIAASVYCKDPIERLAAHDVKWTDGTFDLKFSRLKWKDKAEGIITYVGDKVKFQNGFGAYSPMIYECDLAADNKTVLAVRAFEGRLP